MTKNERFRSLGGVASGMKLLASQCELSRFAGHTSDDVSSPPWWGFFPGNVRSSLPKVRFKNLFTTILKADSGPGDWDSFNSVTKVKIWHPGNISASNSCCVEMRFFYQPYIGVSYSSWKAARYGKTNFMAKIVLERAVYKPSPFSEKCPFRKMIGVSSQKNCTL